MKICFLLSQPFGKSIGTDVRNFGLIYALAELGNKVHVYTPYPDDFDFDHKNILFLSNRSNISYLTQSIYEPLKNYIEKNDFIVNSKLYEFMVNRAITTMGNYFSLKLKNKQYDIIQCEQQLASISMAGRGDEIGAKIVSDFHGVWSQEILAMNNASNIDNHYKHVYKMEKKIYEKSDGVIGVSKEMRNYLGESYGFKNNVFIIPNATYLRTDVPAYNEKPRKIIHSGTLHPWENVELYINSIPYILKEMPHLKFYITKKGAKLSKVKQLEKDLRIKLHYIWFDQEDELYDFLKTCDLGVISANTHIARKMAYPAKLFDYLSVGLPIVSNDVGSWSSIITDYDVGYVSDNDPKSYADCILKILKNNEFRLQCANRAIKAVKDDLNYYNSARQLLSAYEILLE